MDIKLYSYWRSSAAYRVRIALNLKGLEYELVPVHLLRDGGEHHGPQYLSLNPQGLVPCLTDGGRVYRQSLAILEYLDEAYPDAPLLPSEIRARGRVRSLAQIVACDIHPLNNLRVNMYLDKELGINGKRRVEWMNYWMAEGFQAFETLLAGSPTTGEFCEGDSPSMADCCLVPQVYNAYRYQCDMSAFPMINSIYQHCMTLPEFESASPEMQPDAEPQAQS